MAKPRDVIVTLDKVPPTGATVNLLVRHKANVGGVITADRSLPMAVVPGSPKVYFRRNVEVKKNSGDHKVLIRVEVAFGIVGNSIFLDGPSSDHV